MDFEYLKNIAVEAALSAGKIMLQYLNDDIVVEKKKGIENPFAAVLTEVDKKCETTILKNLLPTCKAFDIGLLSEEGEDNKSRFEKDFFWCIDPMDGTLAFINKYPGFSVSIALIAKDGTPVIGVVFNPSTNTLYYAIKGKGAYKNDELWQVELRNDYLTYVTDGKLKNTPNSDKIEKILQEKVTQLGLNGWKEISGAGSVLNGILVLENAPACMFKFPKRKSGGGSIWDFAATACIYHELGFRATNFQGGKLDLNRKNSTFMNHEGVFYSNF